jgi:N-acetyl sugar amidotransferase
MTDYIRKYQMCVRCILDTNDYPDILFDEDGICNICHTYDMLVSKTVYRGVAAEHKIIELIYTIKKAKKNNTPYDCLLGISGGSDSSYLAYLAKKWGLNPLMIHVDNGWNSERAVGNIEKVVKKLSLDLYTYVINWEDMKDMHLSFLKASVVDIELPFDNTYIAALYEVARKFKLKHILLGENIVTEGWLPPNFNHYKMDSMNIRAIHKKFGQNKITNFPVFGIVRGFFYNEILKIKIHSPLNYIDKKNTEIKEFLKNEFEWHDYPYKHFENIFTRFYQGYILPQKFGVDKRKSHLSTLICAGQITKENALEEIKTQFYNPGMIEKDKEFVLKKLGITCAEFESIMNLPVRKHTDYKSYINIFKKLRFFIKLFRRFFPRKSIA